MLMLMFLCKPLIVKKKHNINAVSRSECQIHINIPIGYVEADKQITDH